MSDLDGATERDRILDVLHASICGCEEGSPTGGYQVRAVDALLAAGFGDVTSIVRHVAIKRIADLTTERDALAARVAAVETLHHSDHVDADVVVHYWCAECGDDWPCATSRALRR